MILWDQHVPLHLLYTFSALNYSKSIFAYIHTCNFMFYDITMLNTLITNIFSTLHSYWVFFLSSKYLLDLESSEDYVHQLSSVKHYVLFKSLLIH